MNNIKRFGRFLNEAEESFTNKVAKFLRDKGEKIKITKEPDSDTDGEITLDDEPLIHVTVTDGNEVYVGSEHEDGFKMTEPTKNLQLMYRELGNAKADATKATFKPKSKSPEDNEDRWEKEPSRIDKHYNVYRNHNSKSGNSIKIEDKRTGKSTTVGLYAARATIDVLQALMD